jgi:hypothetical protein
MPLMEKLFSDIHQNAKLINVCSLSLVESIKLSFSFFCFSRILA